MQRHYPIAYPSRVLADTRRMGELRAQESALKCKSPHLSYKEAPVHETVIVRVPEDHLGTRPRLEQRRGEVDVKHLTQTGRGYVTGTGVGGRYGDGGMGRSESRCAG